MGQKTLSIFTVTLSLLILVSPAAWAKDYAYQAEIKGMACAFCAYNVSKKTATIVGVDNNTINVNLKDKRVEFQASRRITQAEVEAAISQTGFTLKALKEIEQKKAHQGDFSSKPVITVTLDKIDTDHAEVLFEALATMASTQHLKMTVEAPRSSELEVMKQLLGGRKKALMVQYSPIEQPSIHLKLFSRY